MSYRTFTKQDVINFARYFDSKDEADCRRTWEEEFDEWAEWFENADRTIAIDEINGVTISTVFLGIDHSFGTGRPLLFETMIFEGELDQEQWRYSTLEEAQKGHNEVVEKVKEVEAK